MNLIGRSDIPNREMYKIYREILKFQIGRFAQKWENIGSSLRNREISHVCLLESYLVGVFVHKLSNEADQRLCFRYTDSKIPLLPMPLAIFCGCTDRFVSDLVGNPEDRFSHKEALSADQVSGP